MVGDKPNRFLIESVSHNNPQLLHEQQRQFDTALDHDGVPEIICFYETEKSPTAQKDKNGIWKMNGPSECLVTKPSATHCRSWEDSPEHMSAIARTHSDMVKVGPHDDEYSKVRERLIGLVLQALVVSTPSQVCEQDIFCYTCDVPGHKSTKCRAKTATIKKGLRKREREGRCFHCGRDDHWYGVCRYKHPLETASAGWM
ncbi:hypothetical protein FLAG1_10201 [Fusarium langsethiae]|uniref:CCHC-type domain-containing protein n=1 Tax=Fusarium langsethiae TaxID=179993 RepID=A0A0M9EPM2_FUSLA|nr:hypothetical protein FLAG1_10201 [Fusarium langsethiae]